MIAHVEIGKIVFMTDTRYCPYAFDYPVSNWIVECNHSRRIMVDRVERKEMEPLLMNRIVANHMGLETLLELFDANDMQHTNKVILMHNSENNKDSQHFCNAVIDKTGKDVYVAEKGLEIDFNEKPL